jgi:hypothetical protein
LKRLNVSLKVKKNSKKCQNLKPLGLLFDLCSDIEESLALHKHTMALANGVIHMVSSPLPEERVEEGEGNSALASCLPAFILQQYSNQCLHHLVPLAIGEPLLCLFLF